MTYPDLRAPQPPPYLQQPRPRRRLHPVTVPLVLTLLAAVAWSGFWAYSAWTVGQKLEGWLEREAAVGRLYQCGDRGIGGFPFRIEVRCRQTRAEFVDTQPPRVIQTGSIVVAAQVYDPNLLIGEFTGPATIGETATSPAYVANWRLAQTSLRGHPRRPERISVIIDDGSLQRAGVSGAMETLAQSQRSEAHLRVIEGSAQSNPVIDVALRLVGGSAAGIAPYLAQPTDANIDARLNGLRDFAPKSWPARFKEIQEANGRIQVRELRVAQGDWLLSGNGSLGLSPSGKLEGELRVVVANLDRLLQTIGVEYAARPGSSVDKALNALDRIAPGLGSLARERAGSVLAAGANMIGDPAEIDGRKAVSLPLKFTDGAMSLGPIPIGRAPAMF